VIVWNYDDDDDCGQGCDCCVSDDHDDDQMNGIAAGTAVFGIVFDKLLVSA
jgi:hypothetical protein